MVSGSSIRMQIVDKKRSLEKCKRRLVKAEQVHHTFEVFETSFELEQEISLLEKQITELTLIQQGRQ